MNSILQVGVGDAVAPVNNWTRKKNCQGQDGLVTGLDSLVVGDNEGLLRFKEATCLVGYTFRTERKKVKP